MRLGMSYGHLMSVCVAPEESPVPLHLGEYGWDGKLGTLFTNDPATRSSLLMMLQRNGPWDRLVNLRVGVKKICGNEGDDGMEPYRPNCYKIPELNGLRVLLVFIVSWYHFWQQSWLTPSIGSYSLDYLLRAGYMPVDGTILLSGFLLFLPYARAMLLGEAVPNTNSFTSAASCALCPAIILSRWRCCLPWRCPGTCTTTAPIWCGML